MRLLYFAWVRERIGRDGEQVSPPAVVSTIADLLDWLSARDADAAAAFSDRTRLRAAADERFVPLHHPLAGVAEVAIFPPVTGG